MEDKNVNDDLKRTSGLRIKINKTLITFLASFSILLLIFYISTIQFEQYVPIFNMNFTAQTLSFILQSLGLKATLNQNNVELSTFVLSVVRQCTGLFEVITLLACILAFPTKIKNKMIGIAIGIPLIYIANIIRLVFLAYLGVYYFSLFQLIHDYILQISFFAFVIFIWLFWLEKVVRKNEVETKAK